MILKTLKDFNPYDNKAILYELKKEAIKWVKYQGELLNHYDWKEFFNIKEEDLKELKGGKNK